MIFRSVRSVLSPTSNIRRKSADRRDPHHEVELRALGTCITERVRSASVAAGSRQSTIPRQHATPGRLVFLRSPPNLPHLHPLTNSHLPDLPRLPRLPCLPEPPPCMRAALSGAVAETLVHLALYPVDTWRTRLHARSTVGMMSPFAGLRIGLVGVALDGAIFSLLYDLACRRLASFGGVRAALLAATFATVSSTVVDAPFALARDRVRLGLARDWRDAWTGVGVCGLYAGAAESVMHDLPFEALEFSVYEWLKDACGGVRTVSAVDMLGLGMLTGGLVGAALSPVDVVVTRCVADPSRYRGVVQTLSTVMREEGLGAVFAGAGQKMAREAASSAMFFAMYDSLRAQPDAGD